MARKILLDYVFPISVITPTPEASTAFLKQACVVAAPKSGQEGNVGEIYECDTMAEVLARTDNENAEQLFNAGMSKVYILLASDLDLADFLADSDATQFFTLLISDDFDADDIAGAAASGGFTITDYAALVSGTDDVISVNGQEFTAQAGAATLGTATFQAATSNDATAASLVAQINSHADTKDVVEASAVGAVVTIRAKERGTAGNSIAINYTDNDTNVGATKTGTVLSGGTDDILDTGAWEGVVGVSSIDEDFAAEQAAIENRSSWFHKSANGAKNMHYAFGKLLSNLASWNDQQYITMPVSDDVDTLGEATSLFNDDVSFVIEDAEFGIKLALFAAGGKAIACPYILKNLRVDMQSAALTWISGNQPKYTKTNATLLENRLQEDVINSYISRGLLEAGTVQISLVNNNFTANGEINVAEPKALWRVVSEMRQTL